MSEDSSGLKTGIFTAAGLALLCVSILIFGGNRTIFKKYVKYNVRFRSTQGLGHGSVVSISGMEAGNIESIAFGDNAELVATINVDQELTRLLTDNSVASIRTQGALGDKYIYITPGSSGGIALKPGQTIPSDTQPDFFDMISGKATDLTSVTETVKELNTLLHNLNSDGKSALLMENLVTASKNISGLMNEPSIREAFLHLKNILAKVDKGDGTLGQLVNNSDLHDRLMSLLGETPRNKFLKPLLREAIKQNEKKQ